MSRGVALESVMIPYDKEVSQASWMGRGSAVRAKPAEYSKQCK